MQQRTSFTFPLVSFDMLLYISTLVIWQFLKKIQLIYGFVPVLHCAAEAEIRLAAVSCV